MGFFDGQNAPAEQPRQMSNEEMQAAFMQDVRGIKRDADRYIRQAGVDIPESMRNNPQAMAMHLIQSGQVPQGRLRMVQPLIDRMMGGRR